ncbi:MAG: hypothetical protein JJE22_20430 [Bacteroidia bacterium]|nr:hypothetical protein [Bacteroidia bacterium]
MKYKYFLMLVLLNGLSFITLSSENENAIIKKLDCKKNCCKCSRIVKPVKEDNSMIEFSPIKPFLIFM